MDRASGGRLKDRAVDFLHHRYGTGRLGSNNDAVGMKKVADGGAFAEELRVRDNIKLKAVNIVDREVLPEALRGLYGHGAFFDHQAISVRGGGDGTSYGFNGAKIRFAIFQRWRADANKNGVSLLDGFCRRHKLQAARSSIAFNQRIQVRLKERQATSVKLF